MKHLSLGRATACLLLAASPVLAVAHGISEADRLRGRIPRSRPSRGQQEESNQERAGRGVVMGHATNADAIPDLRLSELERLFAI